MNRVKVLNGLLAELKRLSSAREKNVAEIQKKIAESKLAMVSLVNDGAKERALGTSILEEAVLFSVETNDSEGFNRNMQQLKVLYFDLGQLQVSSRSTTMLGLNLLKLLKEGRVVELFTELERIPADYRESPEVSYVVNLQDSLTEGKYEDFLKAATHNPPNASYRPFLSSLKETARQEIGRCVVTAYNALTLPQARRLLMLDAGTELAEVEELLRSAASDDIAIEVNSTGKGTIFLFSGDDEESKFGVGQRHAVIQEALKYADELEKII